MRQLGVSGLRKSEGTAQTFGSWKPDLSRNDDFPVCAKKMQLAAGGACGGEWLAWESGFERCCGAAERGIHRFFTMNYLCEP